MSDVLLPKTAGAGARAAVRKGPLEPPEGFANLGEMFGATLVE